MPTRKVSPLAARVDAWKRPDRAEPWMSAVAGPQYFLLVTEIEAAALAEGIVLLRTQLAARNLTRYLDLAEEAAP